MIVTFGRCRLNLDRRELHVSGAAVRLPPKTFELLRILVENRGRAVSKVELAQRLWPNVHVTNDSLARLICELRTALGDVARNPEWVLTVHGFGYRFALADTGTESLAGASAADPSPDLLARYVLQCGSRQFLLSDGIHLIGRDREAAIHMHSAAVSRRHARITVSYSGATIEDLGSKNGTFIGPTQVGATPVPIGDDQDIRIADFALHFSAISGTATETLGA